MTTHLLPRGIAHLRLDGTIEPVQITFLLLEFQPFGIVNCRNVISLREKFAIPKPANREFSNIETD